MTARWAAPEDGVLALALLVSIARTSVDTVLALVASSDFDEGDKVSAEMHKFS